MPLSFSSSDRNSDGSYSVSSGTQTSPSSSPSSSSNDQSFASTVASWTSDASVIDAYRSPSINVGSSTSSTPSFADTVATWTSDTSVIDAYRTTPTLESIYGSNADTFFNPTPFSPDYRDLAVNTSDLRVTPTNWAFDGSPSYAHGDPNEPGVATTNIPVGDRTIDGMKPMESYVMGPTGTSPYTAYTDEVMDYQLNKAIAQEEQMAEAFEDKDYVVSDYKNDVYRYTTDSRDPMRYGVDYAETLARASGQAFQTQGPLSSYVRDPSWWDKAVSKVTGEVFGDVNKPFVIDPVKGIIAEITDDHEIIDGLSQIFSAVTGIGLTLETAEAIATDGSGQMYSYRGMEGTVPSVLANIFGVDQYTLRTQEEQAAIDEKAREAAAAQSSDGGTSSAYVAPVTTSAQTPTVNRNASAYLTPTVNTAVSPTRVSFSTDYSEQTPYVNPYFRLYSSRGFQNAAYGGKIQKMAEGGVVQEQAPQEQVTGPAGFVGQNPEQVAESQTVADDVAMEVPEGTFVLNAAAVEFAGSADIKKMLVNAMGEAKRQGLDISTNDNTMSNDDAVSLLVSQGEVVIPPQLAKIIGYDKLNKINNRGVKETEQRLEEQQAQQQPDQQMACGGFAKKRAKGSEGTGEVADDSSLKTHERLYMDFLAGKTDDITEADFNDEQLREIGRIVKEKKASNDKWENQLLELYNSGYPFRKNDAGENVDSEDNAWWYYQNPDLTTVEDEMGKLADKLRTFETSRGRTSISDYGENINEPVGGYSGYMDQREDVNYQVRASLGKFTAHDNPDGSVTIRDAYNYNHSEYDPSLSNFIMNIPNMGSLQNVAEVTARHVRPEHSRNAVINIPAEYLK